MKAQLSSISLMNPYPFTKTQAATCVFYFT